MHVRIFHCLAGSGAMIHAHVEAIASALFQEVSTVPVGLAQAFDHQVRRVRDRHEQAMAGRDWVAIAENLDRVKVYGQFGPGCYSLGLGIC
jgi:hypothetical protein